MKKTLLIAGALAAPLLLAGCSNTSNKALSDKIDSLSDQVSALQAEQSTLSSDVNSAKMAAQEAKSEAARANQRIDHIAKSYTK
ncbi:Lpp/OprI family alanine-zipper lipoprotein [Celerinatantimonas sp. MCCC 1A17872]|uniref:Lpp/OprI family alanine-zipper lipoprotein n=1 Tax=Celerinatantimonas sp. MCCC 1A17872 TaxID=3177514 RepID=UPI0038C14748